MKKLVLLLLMCALLVTSCSRDESDAAKGDGSGSIGLLNPSQMSTPLPKPDDVQFELNGSTPNFQEGSSQSTGGKVDLSQIPDYTGQDLTSNQQDGDSSGDNEDNGDEENPTGGGSPSSTKPDADNKYPNTGIFLEDD